jgi:hypothetical protein
MRHRRFMDDAINEVLGVDGVVETAVYMSGDRGLLGSVPAIDLGRG